MFQSSPTDPIQRRILLWLSDLEQRGGGYELRGVCGWAHLKEIAAALDRHLADQLVSLAERKLVDRESIALPGRGNAVWLHRLSVRGASVAGVAAPAEPGPPEAAPPPRMIFTDAQWASLQYMRNVKNEPFPVRFTAKETGWRTVKEIREGADLRGLGLQIWPEDVYQLERAGLLAKRNERGADGARRLSFYRVSDLGERVVRLERHSPVPPSGK